jgi:hypothetical protein
MRAAIVDFSTTSAAARILHLLAEGVAAGVAAKVLTSVSPKLQRLIVVAVAITLRRGDVAILDVVIFDGGRRRFHRFAAFRLGKSAVFVGSAHLVLPGIAVWPAAAGSSRRVDLNLTAFDGDISGNRTIFPAFFRRSV